MKGKKNSISRLLVRYSRVILAITICIIFGISSPRFFTFSNMYTIIVNQMPFMALMSYGMAMAIITLGIDNSIGAIMGLTACVAALMMNSGMGPGISVLIAIILGIGIGLLNGVLIAEVKMPPFITTYGMDWVFRGIAYVIMGGGSVFGFSKAFKGFFNGKIIGLSNSFWCMVIVTVVLIVLLNFSTFGRNFYSIGMNPTVAKLSGVRTKWLLIIIYSINGLLAAIVGMFYMAKLNVAEGAIAEGWTLKLMAAVLIGGTPMTGGKGGIPQTLLGVFIMVVLTNGLNILNISSLWQQVVTGLVIVLSIILEQIGTFVNRGHSY